MWFVVLRVNAGAMLMEVRLVPRAARGHCTAWRVAQGLGTLHGLS